MAAIMFRPQCVNTEDDIAKFLWTKTRVFHKHVNPRCFIVDGRFTTLILHTSQGTKLRLYGANVSRLERLTSHAVNCWSDVHLRTCWRHSRNPKHHNYELMFTPNWRLFHGTVGTILHDQLFRRDVHNPLIYIHTIPQHRYDTVCVSAWWQATGLDAWASRVKCPARFVSHLHEICIYIYELFIAFVSFVVCSLL